VTEAEAKKRLADARAKAKRYRLLREAWRRIVAKRLAYLHELRQKQVRRRGNLIEGGTVEGRAAFLFRVAPAHFRSFYSEEGRYYKPPWAVTNVHADTFRSDCSAWARAACLSIRPHTALARKVADAGAGFYTGWVVEKCPQVDRHYAETHIGTAVVYGTGTGFHMGLSLAEGSRTIQHGTPPLDYGSFDEFGPGTEVRYFAFIS